MEKGKFYSLNETSEMLVGKRLFERDALKEHVPEKSKGKRFVPTEDMMTAICFYAVDISYVASFIITHTALGNLREGLKNKEEAHFAKK
jgi:hypothetical protein